MITRILHRQRSCRDCGCVRFHPLTCVCLYVRVCVLSCWCMCVSVHQGSPGLGLHQCKQQIKTSFPILFHKERKGGFFYCYTNGKLEQGPPRGRGCSVMSCCCHGYCVIIVLSQGETVIWSSCSVLLAARQIDTLQSHTHTLIENMLPETLHPSDWSSD